MEPATPSLFGSWNNPAEWNLANYLTLLGLAIAVLSVITPIIIEIVKWFWQKRKRQILEKHVDATSYSTQVIENATKYYIRPRCSNIDPAQEAEIRNAIATSEDLFRFVDEFLEGRTERMHTGNNPINHLIVLADSGMGKTTFVLNYFVHNRKKRLKKRKRIAIVHLGTPDALERIRAIQKQHETELILDAFDEDTKAVETPTGYRTRMEEIFKACGAFNHVIITCRTQFFPRDAEIPSTTGVVRIGPRGAGEGGHYDLRKIYLNPLSDKQVDQYLNKRYPGFLKRSKRKKAAETVKKIPLLSARPMLLTYIPDLLKSNVPITRTSQLYEIMVEKWLEREKGWISETDNLRTFSEEMAIEIYINRKERGAEIISREEILETAQKLGIDLEDWKLTGRSLLNRNAEGNFKFAHRSIMEYLFIKQYFDGDSRCGNIEWTDFMKTLFLEQIKTFYRKTDLYAFLEIRESINGADLSNMELDVTFRKLLNRPLESEFYIQLPLGNYSNINLTGARFKSIAFTARYVGISNFDFSNSEGTSIDFGRPLNIFNVNLSEAKMTKIYFRGTNLSHVNFKNAKIDSLFVPGSDLSRSKGLSKDILQNAWIDQETKFPADFELTKVERLIFALTREPSKRVK